MQDRARIRGFYTGSKAETYEETRAHKPKWRREHAIVEQMLRRLAPGTVLDVPVGTGRFIDLYHDLGIRFTGVDVSEDMLAIAKGRTQVGSLVHGDITALAFADASVDLALCIRFLNLAGFGMVQDTLDELVRVSSSHVIVGITLRRPVFSDTSDGLLSAMGRAARQLKSDVGYRGKPRKVFPHPEKAFLQEVKSHNLRVEDRQRVNVRGDGSIYDIFLLAK